MTTVIVCPHSVTKFLDRAGNLWVYLQYALGLQAIGCDVHWLERLERPLEVQGERRAGHAHTPGRTTTRPGSWPGWR